MQKNLLYLAVALMLLIPNTHAYFNVTSLNTTVTLNPNNSAHVTESFKLYISNSSLQTYFNDRQAINLTLSGWQKALQSDLLATHILNPKSGIYGFTILPSPITYALGNGTAILTMSYYVNNVTTEKAIGPRKFEYTFNDTVFNFAHIVSGQTLPPYARLNIIIPKGSEVVSVYPVPDYPHLNFIGNYTGSSQFSWYSNDPLATFSFSYIISQSPGQEVTSYFAYIYTNYKTFIYFVILVLFLVLVVYLYARMSENKV